MQQLNLPLDDRTPIGEGESRLRLQTIVRLRWFAVLGQLAAITLVYYGLGFDLPVGYCLGLIALSAWVNVFLSIRYPARHRLSVSYATVMLAYDIAQLTGLLYFTGGIENPFTVLLVAPVTVSAATLPPLNTIVLGFMAACACGLLVERYWPLPWYAGFHMQQPFLYKVGIAAAINSCMAFLALYAYRLSKESRQMSAALAATEHILAREQKLHALDGLAAAAAHELGTPLATIVLTTKEMLRELPKGSPLAEDIDLLNGQAQRCREILQKLTRAPSAQDPMHASLSVRELIEEAAGPYRSHFIPVIITASAAPNAANGGTREPVGQRQPGVIFGVGNIIENAVDFARNRVEVRAEWSTGEVAITIADDGPGFAPDVMDTLGEPYVTTRSATKEKKDGEHSGLGLGFFIAKTLLERSGAHLTFENRPLPAHGAVVRISWRRGAFEAPPPSMPYPAGAATADTW